MKNVIRVFVLAALCATPLFPARADTPADEQAFLATYQKAFEARDEKTLQSFLYVKGADPMVLDFYKAMQASGMGGAITRIALVALTPEDEKKVAEIQDSPGGKMRLPLAPTKKLVLEVKESSGEGSSTSTSECFVGEVDGKLVILVPARVK